MRPSPQKKLKLLAATLVATMMLLGCQEDEPLTLVSRHFETCIRSGEPVQLALSSGIDSQLGTIVVDGVEAGIHLGAHPQANDLFAPSDLDAIGRSFSSVREIRGRYSTLVVYASRVTSSDYNFVRLSDGGTGASVEQLQEVGGKLVRCDGEPEDYLDPVALLGQVDDPEDWTRHCTLDGLPAQSEADLKWLASFVDSCEALDACYLACVRSGCARSIAGSCAHACGPAGARNLALAANQFSSRTSTLCHGRFNEPYDAADGSSTPSKN